MRHWRGAHVLVPAPQFRVELVQLAEILRLLAIIDVADAAIPAQRLLQAGHVVLAQIVVGALLDEGERHGEHKGHRTADDVHEGVGHIEAQDKSNQDAQRAPQLNGEC